MSSKLIKLGSDEPELQKHLRPVIDFLKQSSQKYWHATSLERAKKIVRSGSLMVFKKGAYAIPADSRNKTEFMRDMATWFKADGYYPDEIAIVEFSTEKEPDRETGKILKWLDDLKIENAKIIDREDFFELT